MAFIVNWVQDKAAGLLATGLQAGGTMAGNAVGGVGTLIENSGRAMGEGVNGSIRGVGSYINGYGNNIIGSMAADGPVNRGGVTQKKTAVKPSPTSSVVRRSSSSAAAARPVKAIAGRTAQATATPRPTMQKSMSVEPRLPVKSVRSIDSHKLAASKTNNSGKTRISPESRPRPVGGTRSASTPARSRPNSSTQSASVVGKTANGKVRVNPESRPRSSIRV